MVENFENTLARKNNMLQISWKFQVWLSMKIKYDYISGKIRQVSFMYENPFFRPGLEGKGAGFRPESFSNSDENFRDYRLS